MDEGLRTVRANGIRIAYRTGGPADGGGTPVVLVHCLGHDGADWEGPLTARLAAGHRLYAPDLRGHGGSDRPGEYGLGLLSEDLRCLLDELGLHRVILIGHSFGSAVASVFAGEHPERVERLVLEETVALLPLDPPRAVPEPPPVPPQFDFEVRRQWNRQRNEPDPRWWRRLARITAPTLIVGGGTGSHLPQEDMAAMAERIPDGRFHIVDGAGHLVHRERPREFTGLVAAFLAEAAPAG